MKAVNFLITLALYALVYLVIGFAAAIGVSYGWNLMNHRKEAQNGNCQNCT